MIPYKLEGESLFVDAELLEDLQWFYKLYGGNKPEYCTINGMIELFHLWQEEMQLSSNQSKTSKIIPNLQNSK